MVEACATPHPKCANPVRITALPPKLVALVQEHVTPVVVLDLVYGVERLDITLPSKESAKIGHERLTVPSHLAVGFIPPYVVEKVSGDVAARSVGQTYVVGEGILRVNKPPILARVLPDVGLEPVEVRDVNVIAPYLAECVLPGEYHLGAEQLVEPRPGWIVPVVEPVRFPLIPR